MPVPLDRLRLAAALVHAVPGARLELTTSGGSDVVVARGPDADLDPCRFRTAVTAGTLPGATDCSRWIEAVTAGGSLRSPSGGVYRFRPDGAVRIFATLLSGTTAGELVASAAEDSGVDADAAVGSEARVVADTMLGASVVFLRVPDTAPWVVDRLAGDVAARCMVAEVVAASRLELRRAPER